MVNKIILVGRMGQDPDPISDKGCRFSMATDRVYNEERITEWHKVNAWGRLGDIVLAYGEKGSLVYVEGMLITNRWEDKTGCEREEKVVMASVVRFLDKKPQREKSSEEEPLDDDGDVPF